MDRNVESHFSTLPNVEIERSIFDIPFSHKTSFNVGDVVPFYMMPVLPGDTFNVTTSFVARLQTLLTPVMDNMYLDTYYFFVPYRICWSHWKEFMGENTSSAWVSDVTYSIPKITSPENGWSTGTIADYLGIPVGVTFDGVTDSLLPSALPFRAVALCMNEWFRDQNLSDPLNIPLGDANQTGSNGNNYITDVVNGGIPFKAAKYHDYFTSCLPSPQKGAPVTFGANPIATLDGDIPVFAKESMIPQSLRVGSSLWWTRSSDGESPNYYRALVTSHSAGDGVVPDRNWTASSSTGVGSVGDLLSPANLWADAGSANLSVSGVSFTINELRLAFQLQKFYERCARSGSRYRETLKAHFGVTSPDARMMIPEYLGGHRTPIQIHQVTNTGESSTAYLGDLGAMSNTSDVHEDFIKSFTEHGLVLGFAVVRYDHSYPQGLPKEFTRESMLDFYWPVFANIGEQPVRTYEIDATLRDGEDRTSVFGYQEAWADYRYGVPARVSGEMRPGITNSLASWHLADYYESTPRLSDSWIREDVSNVDRVLAVGHTVSNQVFCDFFVHNRATRPMPMYSVPGLIDHH